MSQNSITKIILRSDELSCPSCMPKIEKALRGLPGVEKAHAPTRGGFAHPRDGRPLYNVRNKYECCFLEVRG